MILAAVENMGPSWRKIAKSLPPASDGTLRSDSSVRNRWKRLCEWGPRPAPTKPGTELATDVPPSSATEPTEPIKPAVCERERAVSLQSGEPQFPGLSKHQPNELLLRRDEPQLPGLWRNISERSVERRELPGLWRNMSERSVERRSAINHWDFPSDEEDGTTKQGVFDAVRRALEEDDERSDLSSLSSEQLTSQEDNTPDTEPFLSLGDLAGLFVSPESAAKFSTANGGSMTNSGASTSDDYEDVDESDLVGMGSGLELLDVAFGRPE